MRSLALLLGLLLALASPARAQPDDPAPDGEAPPRKTPAQRDLERLAAAGVAPTLPGFAALIRRHGPPDADAKARARALVARLADPDWSVRERAMGALATMPRPPVDALRAAAADGDPERAWRARQALAAALARPADPTLLAACRVIERRRLRGLLAPLLAALPGAHPLTRRALERAALASVTADDDPTLEAVVDDRDASPLARGLATRALAGLSRGAKNARREWLAGRLDDRHEPVRLAAADGLARLGDRRALAALAALLDAGDARHRARAAGLLRALTGRRFGYSPRGPARAEGARAWRAWLAAHPRADLVHPLPTGSAPRGRILMAIYPDTLREIDLEGRTVMESKDGWKYIWGVHGTPEGHRLAIDYKTGKVVERDATGAQVWSAEVRGGQLHDVERTAAGTTLVAAQDRAVELDAAGEEIWSWRPPSGIVTAVQRLPDGLTMCCVRQASEVVTVDGAGEVVHRLTGLTNPYHARRLPNGNTLVLSWQDNTVWELDRAGKTVWNYSKLDNPASCQRLSNGNTLISDNRGLHEIDPEGNEVWTYRCGRARFHRY